MKHDKEWLPDFSGPFKDLLPDYIRYKRALGYKMSEPSVYKLREMDLFFKSFGVEDVTITREMYEAFTAIRDNEKQSTTQRRVSAFRGFAKYLQSLGYEGIYDGTDDTRIFKKDFIPYVFSREEILRIFKTLDKWCLEKPGRMSETFRILIILYYCCGMRKAEVLDLKISDMDPSKGTLTVYHGKNDVARIIPVSASVKKELIRYQERYLKTRLPDSCLFFSPKGKRFDEHLLYRDYRRLLIESNIAPRADGKNQRLHDLRHSFCVHTLEEMSKKGFDLYTALPLLSKYLGHKYITETEYYLRMMEEHFGDILEKTDAYIGEIFPVKSEEVTDRSGKGGD